MTRVEVLQVTSSAVGCEFRSATARYSPWPRLAGDEIELLLTTSPEVGHTMDGNARHGDRRRRRVRC